MNIPNLFSFLLRHRPTDKDIDDAKALASAAEAFLRAITTILPDVEGKKAAIEAANAAVMHANAAVMHANAAVTHANVGMAEGIQGANDTGSK